MKTSLSTKTAIIAAALFILPCSAHAIDCDLIKQSTHDMAVSRDQGLSEQAALAMVTTAGGNDDAIGLVRLIYTDQASMTPDAIGETDYQSCRLTLLQSAPEPTP